MYPKVSSQISSQEAAREKPSQNERLTQEKERHGIGKKKKKKSNLGEWHEESSIWW